MEMPESPAPKKIEIKINVSPALLEQALKIAEDQGKPPAEFHRQCWEQGLAAMAETDTKLKVNEKVRRRLKNDRTGDDE